MNPDTVAIAATGPPGEVEEVHPFHQLFDLVAVNGWYSIMAELAEVAHVRSDGAMAAVFAVVTEGLGEHAGDRRI
jgi:hypothetical protein